MRNLHRLGHVLTGDRHQSVQMVADTVDAGTPRDSFFEGQIGSRIR